MRPSELRVGDRIITTTISVHESCPANKVGTVMMVGISCGFGARMDHDNTCYCISFSGAKVMRRKS